jgi:hypothetical protein
LAKPAFILYLNKKIMKYGPHLFLFILAFVQSSLYAQSYSYRLDSLAQKGALQVQNRSITPLPAEKGIRFSAAADDGVAWLNGVEFSNGIIEFDVRGKDVVQQSFIGVAFHGISRDSLEAVYFRPFNFQTTDAQRHLHMVQYVSHPEYTWDKLRAERTGIFEKPIPQAPAPTDWFHARIIVKYPSVKVYVNQDLKPCLEVTELSNRRDGRIGLWVGNNSDGDFANLVITDQK